MVESVIILSFFMFLIVAPFVFAANQPSRPEDEEEAERIDGTHFMKG